jgi:hypothetical protein
MLSQDMTGDMTGTILICKGSKGAGQRAPENEHFLRFFEIRRPIAENWRHLAAMFLHWIVVLVGLVVGAKYELHSCHRSGENAVQTDDIVHFRTL